MVYLNPVVFWLKITFMYPTTDRWRIILTVLIRWIFRLSLYNTFIACFLRVWIEEVDPVAFLNLAIYGSSIITTHFLQNHSNQLKEIIDQMHQIFLYESTGVDQPNMKKYIRRTNLFCKTWISMITISAQIMIIYPVFYNNNRRDFAIPIWYPFETKETPIYEILLTLQCIGHFVVTCAYGAADSLLVSILVLTAKQFEIIGYNVENLLENVLLKHEISLENFLTGNIEKTELMKGINMALIENICQHQKLLKFCRQLEFTMWPLVFLKVTVSAWYHIMIFLMLVMSNDVTLIILFGQYEMLAMFELLVICAAGDHLITKGNDFSLQISRCPWYLFDKAFRTHYLLLTIGSVRQVGVSVGKMAQLSLTAFLSIVKTSFSYFAVLRQVVLQK